MKWATNNDSLHDNTSELNGSNITIDQQKTTDSVIQDDNGKNEDLMGDRNLIMFIKESMIKEKLWNEDIRKLMNDQINYLKKR